MAVHFFGCLPSIPRRFIDRTTGCTGRGPKRVAPNGSRMGICACYSGQFRTEFPSLFFARTLCNQFDPSMASDCFADCRGQFHRYLWLLASDRDSKSRNRPAFGITATTPVRLFACFLVATHDFSLIQALPPLQRRSHSIKLGFCRKKLSSI